MRRSEPCGYGLSPLLAGLSPRNSFFPARVARSFRAVTGATHPKGYFFFELPPGFRNRTPGPPPFVDLGAGACAASSERPGFALMERRMAGQRKPEVFFE
jgi:hypothetical protein